ncbi:PREDICTED: 60S acidic ribosomal protein P2-like [Amphimedon queenslandica]|uniref:Large ribosomal subunit protein P2 n=1 Tax=Amphimedon queenslandica TaxID=400682 RepID=A0A1X7UQX3_AMPQE|nr:PREDICTED: 60S acidic ribosomal protein P2-like [Amphimedon queenslandica]|eukprot:XP_003386962.1 PREDICTED: 60S acidic ribosomal protein P2-like [Amphimedon queenslandica]
MRYVAAYLLASLGSSKDSPTKEDITKILESVGLEIEDDQLDKVISELKGKDINDVIAEGMGKLASIPSGGVAAASGGGGGAAAGGGGDGGEKEEKKEEKKEESEEESDDDMGFGLFD